MNDWLRVEFHCHTIYSSDGIIHLPQLLREAARKGIDRLIITDHNSIRGALRARELDPERVIIGEEIMTDRGELLAAFVVEEVPPGLPALETIRRLREQGAFISVSHPFDHQRAHWRLDELLQIAPLVDAIEVFNARSYQAEFNDQAAAFAQKNGLAGTVGSDAHALFELGRATLLLPPFESADDLRRVIGQGKAETRLSGTAVHLVSGLSKIYKKMVKFNPDVRVNG